MHFSLTSSQGELSVTSSPEALNAFLKSKRYSGALLISDKNVFPLYGKKLLASLQSTQIRYTYHLLEGGESAKSFEHAQACWQKMHAEKLDRNAVVIGLGGGSVTDLAGFVASCYMRGVDVVHVPTSLLAMVDASIGGKTGINLPGGKNLVGTFHPPKFVSIDVRYLETLPHRELCSGLAEVIKYGVVYDPALFESLESHFESYLRDSEKLAILVHTTCGIKIKIVDQDPTEKGIRMILNYGHTFGHALESATDYQRYSHGEAVAMGMCCAARLGLLLGLTPQALLERQKALCQKAGLPTAWPSDLDNATIIRFMQGDKKATSGKIRLILPLKLGSVIIKDNVSVTLIDEALTRQKYD